MKLSSHSTSRCFAVISGQTNILPYYVHVMNSRLSTHHFSIFLISFLIIFQTLFSPRINPGSRSLTLVFRWKKGGPPFFTIFGPDFMNFEDLVFCHFCWEKKRKILFQKCLKMFLESVFSGIFLKMFLESVFSCFFVFFHSGGSVVWRLCEIFAAEGKVSWQCQGQKSHWATVGVTKGGGVMLLFVSGGLGREQRCSNGGRGLSLELSRVLLGAKLTSSQTSASGTGNIYSTPWLLRRRASLIIWQGTLAVPVKECSI